MSDKAYWERAYRDMESTYRGQAAELDRLRAINEELVEAGNNAFRSMCDFRDNGDSEVFQDAIDELGLILSKSRLDRGGKRRDELNRLRAEKAELVKAVELAIDRLKSIDPYLNKDINEHLLALLAKAVNDPKTDADLPTANDVRGILKGEGK